MAPELQKPFPVNSGVPGTGGGQVMSGRAGPVVKQGAKTAGFCWPFFSTTGGASDRSLLTPSETVWMSLDERLSKTRVSPGRTEIAFGKYVP